jgi:hypothetical protein
MSITEKSDIITGLYRARAELGVLLTHCQDARALTIAIAVQNAQAEIVMVIDGIEKEEKRPAELVMATPKF